MPNIVVTQIIKFAQQISDQGVNIPRVQQDTGEIFTNVLTVVFGVMGAVSVLIITIAAFQYITSTGDPQKTAKAKDTIMYAVIGLVVAVMAVTIIQFVFVRATR